jgi:hypothetical protein
VKTSGYNRGGGTSAVYQITTLAVHEFDPLRGSLHLDRARCLRRLGRDEEAARDEELARQIENTRSPVND